MVPLLVAVVDDDTSVRTATAALLSSAGIASRTFPSATAFLAQADPREFACIVSDIQLPGMSGLELHAAVRRHDNPPPFIFVTAFPGAKVKAAAMAGGARALFEKPLDGAAFLALLDTILSERSASSPE